MQHVKDWLPVAQLVSTILTVFVMGVGAWKLSFAFGRFTEKLESGLLGIRQDLSEHTEREESRFAQMTASMSELKVGQATHDVRLKTLEVAGGARK